MKHLYLAVALAAIPLSSHSAEIPTPAMLGTPSQSITFSTPNGELLTIFPDGSVAFGPAFTTTQEMARETIRIIAKTYGEFLYHCPGVSWGGKSNLESK